MEGESFLAGGYGLKNLIQSRPSGWLPLRTLAHIWQPSRLKGIQVSPEFGSPFLAAMQVFDIRPSPRKWLSLDRTEDASQRFVAAGQILVTCSGSVGRATLAYAAHQDILISHDLLRVAPRKRALHGWLYAYLLSPQARAIMEAAQYGHVIKHLEVSHLDDLPIPLVDDTIARKFQSRMESVLEFRNRAFGLIREGEALLDKAVGVVTPTSNPLIGFSVKASSLLSSRRRLEASFHNPTASSIVERFAELNLKTEPLQALTERIWWMTRFKRVFGLDGVRYMSADELFSVNPPITKRVMIEQAEDPSSYFVKAGWIMMACSGQTYGLNGSVALMSKRHESAFFSHDLVRMIPKRAKVRPGYLFAALGHPRLGRPLVIRYAYGTSIPHLEPLDLVDLPIVRLKPSLEDSIADRMEEAAELYSQAEEIEDQIAADAGEVISRFIAEGRA